MKDDDSDGSYRFKRQRNNDENEEGEIEKSKLFEILDIEEQEQLEVLNLMEDDMETNFEELLLDKIDKNKQDPSMMD